MQADFTELVQKAHVLDKEHAVAERQRVVAVGAANMDIAGSSEHGLVGGDSIPGRIRCAPGGVARNVAENLARLGLDVRLLSVVGDDLYGRSLLDGTRKTGVDVRGCEVLGGQATSTYLSLHGPDGDMAAAVNDMSILEQITPAWLQRRAARLRSAAALVLDCNLSPDALGWLFAHTPGVPVFADCVSAFKCRRLLPWLGGVHTLKANRLEAQALCGQPVRTDRQIERAARWLHAQGVQQVVLSLGARGVYWSERTGESGIERTGETASARTGESGSARTGEPGSARTGEAGGARTGASGWQAALPVVVVNATGAGDALMAGLLYDHLHGAALAQAVSFASGCAALTLTAPHANHPGLSVAAVQQLRNGR